MSDLKGCFSILNLNLRLLQLDDVSMPGSLVDVLQEALQYLILALRFTFNLYLDQNCEFDLCYVDLLCCSEYFAPIPLDRTKLLSCV